MEQENEEKLEFEATVHDVRLHNSKVGDDNWVDVVIRVAGEAGIQTAMLLHKAKSKLVTVSFEEENE